MYWEIFKGYKSVNTVGGVMVLDLYISSDDVLRVYQVLSKYLIGFLSYGPEQQGQR